MTDKITDTKKIPVLMDCDPGADDVFALLWILIAHQSPHTAIDLKALTTLGGNVAAEFTYLNALRMKEFVGATIPVGKDLRPVEGAGDASHIHGQDGIGNLSTLLPDPTLPTETLDSVQLIIDTINEAPGEVILLVTGPMTNLAAAERRSPGILNKAKYIVAMGGSFCGGNVTPTAEFNIWYDADSAAFVNDTVDNLVLIPLDVTQSFVFAPEDAEQFLSHINSDYKAEFIRKLTDFAVGTNRMFRETHYQNGFFVHDGHTVGWLLYPHLYKGSLYDLWVETKGEHTKGMTVADFRNHARANHSKTFVVIDVDREGFLEALVQDFREFDFDKK